MSKDSFVFPTAELCKKALEFTKNGLEGTEIFTYLNVNNGVLPKGEAWCKTDELNNIKAVIINDGKTFKSMGDTHGFILGNTFTPNIFTMVYNNGVLPPCNNAPKVTELNNSALLQLYSLISKKNSASFDDGKFYVYRVRCKNAGFMKGFCITNGNELLSCALIAAQNNTHCLIADVFTVPQKRRQGYASLCVISCINYALSLNKTPFVYCEKQNIEFYKSLGFKIKE